MAFRHSPTSSPQGKSSKAKRPRVVALPVSEAASSPGPHAGKLLQMKAPATESEYKDPKDMTDLEFLRHNIYMVRQMLGLVERFWLPDMEARLAEMESRQEERGE